MGARSTTTSPAARSRFVRIEPLLDSRRRRRSRSRSRRATARARKRAQPGRQGRPRNRSGPVPEPYARRPRHRRAPLPRDAAAARGLAGAAAEIPRATGASTSAAPVVERRDRKAIVTMSNPRFLNAEDASTIDAHEIAADLCLLDSESAICILRGDRVSPSQICRAAHLQQRHQSDAALSRQDPL